MKIKPFKLPFTKKSALIVCFFACMFVFASFTKQDRYKVRAWKVNLMNKIADHQDTAASYKDLHTSIIADNVTAGNSFPDVSTLSEKLHKVLPSSHQSEADAAVYSAKEKEGVIGIFSKEEEDRISDNFFTVDIPAIDCQNTSAYLEYDLFGLASHQSVSRSINKNIAIGGNVVIPYAGWSHQREAIGINQIKNGINTILFTSPTDGIKYKVKNLKIGFSKDKKYSGLNINSMLSNGNLYLTGNHTQSSFITVNKEHIAVQQGEFEQIIQLSEAEISKGTFSITDNGVIHHYKVPEETKSFKTIENNYFKNKQISVSNDQEIDADYENLHIRIEKETSETAKLEILKLRAKDFPAVSQGLKNITKDNAAYRVSVVSGKLNKKVKLTLSYDLKRLGLLSPKEIKVFRFDYTKKQWVVEKSSVVDIKAHTVSFEGDGDGDYINGIISTPESPQINASNPTSISGLKAADPMSGNQLMNPPTANQKGDANLNYSIRVPAGLNGLQPSLSIGYNSNGGNGWMGEGWDIQGTSSITIDTRWGTPVFNTTKETELYSLDGEMLVYPNEYLPHRHNNESVTNTAITTEKQGRSEYVTNGVKKFYLRKNHDFTLIERSGNSPSDYSWKITSTNGTKNYYGGNLNSIVKNGSGAIVQWALSKVEDSHGNIIEYTYKNIVVSGQNNNLDGGVFFHIEKVSYGKNKDYTVNFNSETGVSRKDININGKQGVKLIEPYLLKSIDVKYKTDTIRTYNLQYEEGQFSKTRLRRLYVYVPSDKTPVIDDYVFDYHDDVADAQGNVTNFGYQNNIQVNNAKDAYGSLLPNLLSPSKINGNTAYEWGINTRPAAGLNFFYPSNDAYGHVMFGVPLGFSNAEAKNAQQLIDFNGDGIQDMIYRVPNEGLWYSEGKLSDTGELSFAIAKPIRNFNSNFSYTKTKTSNWGFDVGLQVLSKSTINSKSLSTTSTYLTDANSDGLIDIVNNREVWFNSYNAQDAVPEMTKHSEYTENMIVKAKPATQPQYIKIDPISAEPVTPTVDVVKVWIASKDGYVRFTDDILISPVTVGPGQTPVISKTVYSVEILNPNNTSENGRIYLTELFSNGSAQHINIARYNTYYSQIQSMLPADTTYNHLGINNSGRLFVKSGDKIYVRLHKNNEDNVEVISTPSVIYVDPVTGQDIINSEEFSQGQFHINNGSYSDNFFLNNIVSPIVLDTPGQVSIKVNPIYFSSTSDSFKFKIFTENINTNTTNPPLYEHEYLQSNTAFTTEEIGINTPLLTFTVNANEPLLLKFVIESDSQTDFKDNNWNNFDIEVTYNAALTSGITEFKYHPVPQYPAFAITQFSQKTDIRDTQVNNNIVGGINDFGIEINKNVTNYSTLGIGSFYYIIKKGNTVLGKRKVTVDNTNSTLWEENMSTGQTVSGISPILFYTGNLSQPDINNEQLINIQVFCKTAGDYALYKKYSEYFLNKPFNVYYGSSNSLLTPVIHTSIHSSIYNDKTMVYNNWGQFLYNSSQDASTVPGISDSFGKLINDDQISDDVGLQQMYSQCNQYANQPDLLYECVSNSIPGSNNTSGTASGNPFVPMKPYKPVLTRDSSRSLPKWIGIGVDQFTTPSSFKDEDSTNNYFTNPIADPPTTTPLTLTSGQLSVITTMQAIDKKQSSQSQNKTLGIQFGASLGNSETVLKGNGSVELQNFTDLNGDGYPDLVYPDSMQLTNSTGGLETMQSSLAVGSFLTDSFSKQKTNSVGFSYSGFSSLARGDVFGTPITTTQANTSMSWSGDVSAGVNDYYDSTDYGKSFWLDLNGDGLPDRITGGGTQTMNYGLNLGKNLYTEQPFANMISYRSHPLNSISFSFGAGLGGAANLQSLGNVGFGVSAGIGASSSVGSADVVYEDINGDGLVDILEVNNNSTLVRYNLGNKFDTAKPLLKEGSSVDFSKETGSYNGSLTFGANAMFNVGPITIVPILPILWIYVKIGLGANANFGLNISDVKKVFKDMNGDGFVDLVVDSGNGFTVNYSKIGRTNKLKSVTNNITQGKYTVDYKFSKPNYQNPHAKLVVKEIKVLNPDIFSQNYTASDNEKDIVTQYTFENSKYDRRERDNFGFETVIREEMDNGNLYRKSIDTYYNNSYLLNGLLRESKIIDGTGGIMSQINNTYELYKLINNTTEVDVDNPIQNFETFDTGGKEGRKMGVVLLKSKEKIVYESGGNIKTTELMSYNNKGSLKNYHYKSPTNEYNSEITYWTGLSNNIINTPMEIRVYQGASTSNLLRQRNTSNLNPVTGDVGTYSFFDGTNNIETDYEYDSYGNITHVAYPPNENNQRYELSYIYDVETSKYVTVVTDNIGSSLAEYLPKYDAVKKSTDIAGNITNYTYDGHGRIVSVTGPNEIGGGYTTIINSFDIEHYGIPNSNQAIKIFKAQTAHYDNEHPGNYIKTDSYSDFLGRVIQVKKDVEINGAEMRSVSGRTIFDVQGRAITQYHPVVENINIYDLNLSLSQYSNSSIYDFSDRVVKTIDEDNISKDIKYQIEGDFFKTTEEFQGMKSETYSNAESQVIKKHNYLDNQPLTTEFVYNPVGEMISSIDPQGIPTSYEYNLAGRRLKQIHPDHGETSYTYDPAGNLISLKTQNLVSQNTGVNYIHYIYDYNRLTDIILPDLPTGANPNNVHYEYAGSGSGNDTGKVVVKQDGTGISVYAYGKMGEVISENRTVSGYAIPTMNFNTTYSYDSWNRIKQINYPDGEQVFYHYNLGGNLKSVNNNNNYEYISNIAYDEYDQRTLIEYGNGTSSQLYYYPTNRRLQTNFLVDANAHTLLSNSYDYDHIGNIKRINNDADVSPNGMGGGYTFTYGYDTLNRLIGTDGSQRLVDKGGNPIPPGTSPYANSNSGISLEMRYNDSGGIDSKVQHHEIDLQVNAQNTYANHYKYISGSHMVKYIEDVATGNNEAFKYDNNGNVVNHITSQGGNTDMFWDEQDRLKAVNMTDTGTYQYYTYDDKGERTIKYNLGAGSQLYQNGEMIDPGSMALNDYKLYPNPYVTITSNGQYTKNYFEGSARFASRLLDHNDIFLSSTTKTASKAADEKKADPETDFKTYLKKAGIEGEVETELAEKASGQQLGLYYLHGDHLGTATFVTDQNSETTQFFLNLPFGETMLEQQSGVYDNPYKFNAKELDSETGLYYYGARYYNPRLSIWYGVDPLAIYNPVMEDEFYGDGEHNDGVYFLGNLNPYIYTYQNPIKYIDPNGKQTLAPCSTGYGGKMEDLTKAGETINRFFSGAGHMFKDAALGIVQTAKISWAINTADKQGIQQGVDEMISQSNSQARYVASGEILDDLQTPEGAGYATAALATFYATRKLGGKLMATEEGSAVGGKVISSPDSPYITVRKGNKTFHISADRVKEYVKNPRNSKSRWGDQINFKKYGVPKGSQIIKGAGKAHKRTPTPGELKMYRKYKTK